MIGLKVIPLNKPGEDAVKDYVIQEAKELKAKSFQERAIYTAFTQRHLFYDDEAKFYIYTFFAKQNIPPGINFFVKIQDFHKFMVENIPKIEADIHAFMQSRGVNRDVDYYIKIYGGEK